MSFVVQQSAVTSPSSASTTSVQDIVDCTSQDIRKQLAASGADANIILDYTNRTSLDILRFSRWKFLLSGVLTFNTVVGEDAYFVGTGSVPAGSTDTTLGLSDILTIKQDSVMDRTNFRRLMRTDEAPLGSSFSQNAKPKLYRNDISTPSIVNIYPPADGVYAIEFRYFKIRQQLTALNQILQVPDDYKDIVCAGVNWLAAKYLSKDADAAHWFQVYQAGKTAMVKDANLFPRDGEFIRPDTTAVIRSTSTGLGLDSGLETSLP